MNLLNDRMAELSKMHVDFLRHCNEIGKRIAEQIERKILGLPPLEEDVDEPVIVDAKE
jgi:hypothetical protein